MEEREWKRLDRHLDNLPRVGRRYLTSVEKEVITTIDIARATQEERFSYWFPAEYRESLAGILQKILAHTEEATQTFFLCGFSNILKRCSIWLSGSTKAQKDLGKVLGDPSEEFSRQVRDMLQRNTLYWNGVTAHGIDPAQLAAWCIIHQGDARHLTLADSTFDLLVTSPPYAICYE